LHEGSRNGSKRSEHEPHEGSRRGSKHSQHQPALPPVHDGPRMSRTASDAPGVTLKVPEGVRLGQRSSDPLGEKASGASISGSSSLPMTRVSTERNRGAMEAEQQKWHTRHCAETDFSRAFTIRDAFDFDDTKKKSVSKSERIWCVGDGAHRNYGTVKVSCLYPVKIHCNACSAFIVDRLDEGLFYFCWRCRRAGRATLLCEGCYEVGERLLEETAAPGLGARRASAGFYSLPGPGLNHLSLPDARPLLDARSPARTPQMSRVTPTASQDSKAPLCSEVPSGMWNGTFEEGRSRRVEKRKLNFLASGEVTGSGAEQCRVTGHFLKQGGAFYMVEWTEMHPWGRLQVSAKLTVSSPADARIEGEFTASDGGAGKLQLQFF